MSLAKLGLGIPVIVHHTYLEVVVKKHWHLILGLTLLIVLVILLATGIIPL